MKVLLIVNTDGALYRFRKPIIKKLVEQGHEVVTLSSESSYFQSIKSLGARPRSLEFFRHSISPFLNLAIGWKIYKCIREESPDIVHCFTHKPAIFGSIAAWLNKTPGIFITVTGLGNPFSNNNFSSRVVRLLLLTQYRLAAKVVDNIFFQNPDDKSLFLNKKIVDGKKAILTNGSGIDINEFSLPSIDNRKEDRLYLGKLLGQDLDERKVVLFTARGVREKGFFDFYGAAKQINSIEPNKFVFIHLGLIDTASAGFLSGDSIKDYAAKSGVFYLGFVENIRDYISASDIMVLPSIYREGTPRSLIEALALGKVIVTTDMPGCRETVIDGWNGFFCKGGDINSLVSKILAIDNKFILQATERSRNLCLVKYDSTLIIEKTLACYKDSLKKSACSNL